MGARQPTANSVAEVQRLTVKLEHQIHQLQQLQMTIRDATREAHTALGDLQRGVADARKQGEAYLAEHFESLIGDAVKAGLEQYNAAIMKAIKEAEQSVYNRFDLQLKILLGEEFEVGDKGTPTFELVRRYLIRHPEVIRDLFATPESTQQIIRRKNVAYLGDMLAVLQARYAGAASAIIPVRDGDDTPKSAE